MNTTQKPYIVIDSSAAVARDASRPWLVVATFRSFNRVINRYPNKEAAERAAAYYNHRHTA